MSQVGVGRLSRTRAPRRTARRARWRAPRYGRSRFREPSGWPARRGASASSVAAFDARDLGADQGGAILEVLRAVLGPLLSCRWWAVERLRVPGRSVGGAPHRRAPPVPARHRRWYSAARRWPASIQGAAALRGRREGGRVVTREEARLQLADPVPAGGDRQARISRQCCLERPSSNSASSKEPNSGVSPRSVRMSRSCPLMMSTTSPNRASRAKSSPPRPRAARRRADPRRRGGCVSSVATL